MKKLVVFLSIFLAIALIFASCGGKKDKGYDIYVYNSKGENAAQFEAMCQAFTAETGIRVKAFSIGSGQDHMEALQAAMNSKDMPVVYSIQGIKELPNWEQGGYVVDFNSVADADFAALAKAIPAGMRLNTDGQKNYGIPYNVEGYGYIVDKQLLGEIFSDVDAVLADIKTASYDEWEAFVKALDAWIKKPSAAKVTLSGNAHTANASKGSLSANLNGVFAVMGSEAWTYGDHFVNVALNAIFNSAAAAYNATDEQLKAGKPAFVDYAKALDLKTSYLAGLAGPAKRGQDFVSSANFGYDQTVQIFADSKAIFFKQGNWAYGNIANVNKAQAERLAFVPVKMPYAQADIVDGATVDKLNRSIPVFVPNYYAVNARSTPEEQANAYKFLVWVNTSPTGQKFLVEDFAFIPYNADPATTTVPNSLGNSIISYMKAGDTLAAPYHGAPGPWSSQTLGLKLKESYMVKETWTAQDYSDIADYAIDAWIKLK